ncbi:hypothetical protein [Rhodococcus sp. LB1]|uniref:hypothetical protein n=1 Tax=Rhodococcus sp. LB1 TaxID=1807499 RepID=UPI0012E721FD|nr:hypothetical protein [Rhodococcus sp. LB1]
MMFEGSEFAVDPTAPHAIRVEGRLLDGKGLPVAPPDGLIEVLQGDQFARVVADDEGKFSFTIRKPAPASLPDGRMQAPFFHVVLHVFPLAELQRTRMYFPDEEEANASDPLLSHISAEDRRSLIPTKDGDVLRWDIYLSGDDQTTFIVPEGEPSILDGGVTPSHPFKERLLK